jgi:hypothetical protein
MVRTTMNNTGLVCGLVACLGLLGGCSDSGSPAELDSGDSEGGGETETPVAQLGCDAPVACDKGSFDGHFFVTDEASVEEIAGYTAIEGQLTIRGSDVSCVQFLACLESTHGLLIEDNASLESLDGMQALREVRGPEEAFFKYGLVISSNPVLDDLSGMSSLTAVAGGDLFIFANDSLETLTGFDALSEVAGDVVISRNAALVDIAGFNTLQEIDTYPNPDPKPDIGQHDTLGGSLVILKHPVLERVTGFTGLIATHRNVTIQYNEALTDLSGLHGMHAIGGGLMVTHNRELCLSEAYAVGGELQHGPDVSMSLTIGNKEC